MDAPVLHPFDTVAQAYDAQFTERRLGRRLREIVWRELADCFRPGETVVELGCGTGEDALWLARRGVRVAATDASPGMLAVARAKAERGGLPAGATFARLDLGGPDLAGDLAELARQAPAGRFDGAFSSFGPLNCLADRRPLGRALATVVRPGGRLVLVVMGPWCPWEVAWYLAHGQVGNAVRRFRSGLVSHVGAGRTIRVWYPSPLRLRRELAPAFRPLRTIGVGAFLPPSQLGAVVERRPRLFGLLAALEERLGGVFPWTWLNDHYLLVLERS